MVACTLLMVYAVMIERVYQCTATDMQKSYRLEATSIRIKMAHNIGMHVWTGVNYRYPLASFIGMRSVYKEINKSQERILRWSHFVSDYEVSKYYTCIDTQTHRHRHT